MRNISLGGMYVETLAKPPAYTCLEVGMETPSGIGPKLVWVPMFVVRCPAAGIGLMTYKNVDDVTDTALERLLYSELLCRPSGATG